MSGFICLDKIFAVLSEAINLTYFLFWWMSHRLETHTDAFAGPLNHWCRYLNMVSLWQTISFLRLDSSDM